MRQSAEKADHSPAWKQEVNRRVAEHNGRKAQPAPNQDVLTETHPEGSLAALAAARVAARYAKAPSYSEMLAAEARPATRPAESASAAVVDAQAAAAPESAMLEPAVLEPASEFHAAQVSEPEFFSTTDQAAAETAVVESAITNTIDAPLISATAQVPSFEIRWDADMPVRDPGPAVARASVSDSVSVVPVESLTQGRSVHDALDTQGFEEVEAAQPIHANLIAFPRELVATRKIRPRRAEGPYAAMVEAQGQLSIFEVEPSAISTEPAAASSKAEANAHTWVGPEWPTIDLDEHSQQAVASSASAPAKAERAKSAAAAPALQLAPLNQRVLAAIVDFSLITAAFLAAVLVASWNTTTLPSVREIELGSVAAWALIGALYQAFFFSLSRTTPGMDYARLKLCTFAGKRPRLRQRFVRSSALFLSLLPLGLGVLWAIFDEQNLTWHDRLSGTYLRKG